jgi:hypothetical protein
MSLLSAPEPPPQTCFKLIDQNCSADQFEEDHRPRATINLAIDRPRFLPAISQEVSHFPWYLLSPLGCKVGQLLSSFRRAEADNVTSVSSRPPPTDLVQIGRPKLLGQSI